MSLSQSAIMYQNKAASLFCLSAGTRSMNSKELVSRACVASKQPSSQFVTKSAKSLLSEPIKLAWYPSVSRLTIMLPVRRERE